MFVDIVKIFTKAGNGGDGHVSFHREKYVPNGGPDGGDGGRGGDVVIVASKDENTLINFRYVRKYKASDGENGGPNNRTGASGEDVVIKVPVGTVVRDFDTQSVVADMFEDGQREVVLRGGKGGRGNARFATPTRQAPRFATPGQKTEPCYLNLELKTIADAGLVGMPNVGKSTLLAALTAAKPKIANYHFTTLAPNLGVVQRYGESFVLADIPGLIEGAAEGAGLGHDFLRHVERTRLILHVVDMSGSEGRDPYQDFITINGELERYSERFKHVPQLVAANKMDIEGSEENLKAFCRQVGKDVAVYPISAAGRQGLDQFIQAAADVLHSLPPVQRFEAERLVREAPAERFSVELAEDGVFEVYGPTVDMIMERTNADDPESMRHFHKLMADTGIIDALRKAGAGDGSTVIMGDWEFDFVE